MEQEKQFGCQHLSLPARSAKMATSPPRMGCVQFWQSQIFSTWTAISGTGAGTGAGTTGGGISILAPLGRLLCGCDAVGSLLFTGCWFKRYFHSFFNRSNVVEFHYRSVVVVVVERWIGLGWIFLRFRNWINVRNQKPPRFGTSGSRWTPESRHQRRRRCGCGWTRVRFGWAVERRRCRHVRRGFQFARNRPPRTFLVFQEMHKTFELIVQNSSVLLHCWIVLQRWIWRQIDSFRRRRRQVISIRSF